MERLAISFAIDELLINEGTEAGDKNGSCLSLQ